MADIFLSYAREDEPRARQLAAALELRGWSVWWDRRIPHGKDFNAYIAEQLDAARCIIVLWSAMALASKFVRDEAAEGLNDGRLVPCLVEAVRPPLGFRQLQAANLTDWSSAGSQDEFERFIESIAAIIAPGAKTTQLDRAVSAAAIQTSPSSESNLVEQVGFVTYVSYAHSDNLQLLHANQGWVSNFHRALENRLGQLTGARLEIWRDPKLDGNDVCSDVVLARLRRVAAFVSVVSPNYVNSEGAQRELAEFLKVAKEHGRGRIADNRRIFKVMKTPVSLDRQPPDLRPLVGYEFFEMDPNTRRAREFNYIFGPEAQRGFWLKLDDLAHGVADFMVGWHDYRSE